MTDPDELARESDIAIRRMRDELADYTLFVGWRNQPHVAEWWATDDDPTPTTPERVAEQYGPRTEDASWVTSCIISLDDRPVGYVQFYPWDAEAEAAAEIGVAVIAGSFGLDIFIGEPDVIDRGVGSRAVALLARHLFEERNATAIALLTPIGNARAHRAYEKVGFRKIVQAPDDLVDGERRMSWLMVLDRPLT